MKKLFISQPMRGKTDEEIKAERAKAVEAASELVGEPVEVIDSGLQNSNAGPDFFNAKLKIDGTLWVGNIEIHIHSWKITGASGRCRRSLFCAGME